jgi:hypothetical protein
VPWHPRAAASLSGDDTAALCHLLLGACDERGALQHDARAALPALLAELNTACEASRAAAPALIQAAFRLRNWALIHQASVARTRVALALPCNTHTACC